MLVVVIYVWECAYGHYYHYQIAAWDSCHLNYGVCRITGLPPPNSQLCLDAPKVVPGRTLKGVCLGDYKTTDCIPQLVTDYLQNKINMDPLITHQLPFDQLHKACELYHAGKTNSIVLLLHFYVSASAVFCCSETLDDERCKGILGDFIPFPFHLPNCSSAVKRGAKEMGMQCDCTKRNKCILNIIIIK
ncbi:hypothetical protein J1605_008301 [Eschrichtius robustus]|uniref:Uncharacterized protein n=1 Tax=Eschrichtius robustus TaxID=9764 RepID=A0AB34GW85_ESCRO|nr:hypothetical protein J1605_008301 [Eschrichtius robustus]